MGLAIVTVFLLILISLVIFSWPTISKFGWSFLWSDKWNPVTGEFGAWSAIIGTLATSIIALIIAVPLSFGVAILIDSLMPRKIAQVMARLVELMAGIPSIVYGIWGLFILLPLVQKIQLQLMSVSSDLQQQFDVWAQQGHWLAVFEPIVMFFVRSMPTGSSVFAASIILALMVIPIISSIMRDVIASIQPVLIEAAYGTGANRWEVVKNIIIPHAAPGLLGAIVLGFGRALGETMAVTFVIGNVHDLKGLFMPSTTISASIANEFNEATGTLFPAALVETGLILFLITFVVLCFSRWLLKSRKH